VGPSIQTNTANPEHEPGTWPNPRYAWYTVSVFALALMINFFDRGIVTLLVEPIKNDLKLSDMEVSMLMGLAYIGFYVVLGATASGLSPPGLRRIACLPPCADLPKGFGICFFAGWGLVRGSRVMDRRHFQCWPICFRPGNCHVPSR